MSASQNSPLLLSLALFFFIIQLLPSARAAPINHKTNHREPENFKNCAELYTRGQTISGVYTIDPDGKGAFNVYCDQTTAGGGWTVIQKRQNGSIDFNRTWDDYTKGFDNNVKSDGLRHHTGISFGTWDRDPAGPGCVTKKGGGWWYSKDCEEPLHSNLNGVYQLGRGGEIYWANLHPEIASGSAPTTTEMKSRPVKFS
ncbi:uncharacterized protein LOC111336692 [Stylophora pistillata]|uniref:uncharacterized protein LOC111336692 n=1 Tax=Stylophora pistillata TaxID=50429 RepID=UPI000C057B07|nr:uncharacterized protein LOC111336692 [Stylophora pistillata]